MELTHLPIIDWEQSKILAGNKQELAAEMLNMLMSTLRNEATAITHAHEVKNYQELHKRLHKLHGALCYCGLPRLKTIVKNLESTLKKNVTLSLPSLINQFDLEVNLLLEHYAHQAAHF